MWSAESTPTVTNYPPRTQEPVINAAEPQLRPTTYSCRAHPENGPSEKWPIKQILDLIRDCMNYVWVYLRYLLRIEKPLTEITFALKKTLPVMACNFYAVICILLTTLDCNSQVPGVKNLRGLKSLWGKIVGLNGQIL